jgi:uncharacterized protein YlxW (UPF0749 family)
LSKKIKMYDVNKTNSEHTLAQYERRRELLLRKTPENKKQAQQLNKEIQNIEKILHMLRNYIQNYLMDEE